MYRCHIRQNQYAEWTFFLFCFLVFPCSMRLWIVLHGRLDCLGTTKPALCLRSSWEMHIGVNISCHYTKRFGVCLAEKTVCQGCWSLGKRWITRQKSFRFALTQGCNSASLPLQWASQQKLAWLALHCVSSVHFCSYVSYSYRIHRWEWSTSRQNCGILPR